MTRKARRPSFGPSEKTALLDALASARHRTIMCGAASGFGTRRYYRCHALAQAIDDLAEELTGHREYFWASGGGSIPAKGTRHGV